MRPRNLGALLWSLFLFNILSSPCSAKGRKRHHYHRQHRRTPCLRLEYALEKAYYAQVDLIRRGLPTRVVQSEFTWAINNFVKINRVFKFQKISGSPCVQTKSWNQVFDKASRAIFAIKYLQGIRKITTKITFLGFKAYPTLPKLSREKKELVETMWLTSLVRLRKRPRTKFKVSDFPFPKNVDVLHDPKRDQACQQYSKFDTRTDPEHDPDAKSVLVALTIVSINLYRRGGNKRSITQMLKHFVGYVFNGVRCLRLEGADIKIPLKLVEAYSRNVAMIRSTITKPELIHDIKPVAAEHVFSDEIHSLLSYNSWGQLKYAVLSPVSSLPVKINYITKIFQRTQYRLLVLYSSSSNLLTPQRSLSKRGGPQQIEKPRTVEHHEAVTCDENYVLMLRQEAVNNPFESCCNEICQRWSNLMSSYVSFPAEGCCSRCNQVNRCDSRITEKDMRDNNRYSFFVPQFGEQDQINMFLVAL